MTFGQLWFTLLALLCLLNVVLSSDCSSSSIVVDIISPESIAASVTSANVLFEPYSYSLDLSFVTKLESGDNLCTNVVNGVYGNQVVLVWLDNSCPYEDQVKVLDDEGAKAVLFGNPVDGTVVYQLAGEENRNGDYVLSIPSRMITQNVANDIETQLDNGQTVVVQFSCFDEAYPSTICILDEDGEYIELDGEYEIQTSLEMNGHPVWMKEGYTNVMGDRYLYVDTSPHQWVWTISESLNETATIAEAFCDQDTSGTNDPTLCTDWYTNRYSENGTLSYTVDAAFTLSNDHCDLSDNHACLKSDSNYLDKSYLGTYRQINDNIPLWIREVENNNDTSFAYLGPFYYASCRRTFSGGFFGRPTLVCSNTSAWVLFNEYNDIIARCDSDLNFTTGASPFTCQGWFIGWEYRPNTYTYVGGQTFDLDDGWCTGYLNIPNTTFDYSLYPTNLCLQDASSYIDANGTLQISYSEYDLFYGDYILVEGDLFNQRPVYVHNSLEYLGEDFGYIFWDDLDDTWVLDDKVPSAETSNIRNTYGYCTDTDTADPSICPSCWSIAFNTDCAKWNLISGPCDYSNTPIPDNILDYQEYICVTTSTRLPYYGDEYTGAYQISDTLYNNRYYYSFNNIAANQTFYIYYYSNYKRWILSDSLTSGYYDLYCIEYNIFDLLDCAWTSYTRQPASNWEFHEAEEDGTCSIYINPTTYPTVQPTDRPTYQPSERTSRPSDVPTLATSEPTFRPSNAPSAPSISPTDRPTGEPTSSPSPAPTSPTMAPTDRPTGAPSAVTNRPTDDPTKAPTDRPSRFPTLPSLAPTDRPSYAPSAETLTPTEDPTKAPTDRPSRYPTLPSLAPTDRPSYAPSAATNRPTDDPTKAPTDRPSRAPSLATPAPTDRPSYAPSAITSRPTDDPTKAPTDRPSRAPTLATPGPTDRPSDYPTLATSEPTDRPTNPSYAPTPSPSRYPTLGTVEPTERPSRQTRTPSMAPTDRPTSPTSVPVASPTRRTQSPSMSPEGLQTTSGTSGDDDDDDDTNVQTTQVSSGDDDDTGDIDTTVPSVGGDDDDDTTVTISPNTDAGASNSNGNNTGAASSGDNAGIAVLITFIVLAVIIIVIGLVVYFKRKQASVGFAENAPIVAAGAAAGADKGAVPLATMAKGTDGVGMYETIDPNTLPKDGEDPDDDDDHDVHPNDEVNDGAEDGLVFGGTTKPDDYDDL